MRRSTWTGSRRALRRESTRAPGSRCVTSSTWRAVSNPWTTASSTIGARSRPLAREPGTAWNYENYDTLLAVFAMQRALGNARAYLEFPRRALLDRIGMRNTLVSVDRFGDFVLSSQVYSNARDVARFGLLYLNGGVWNGERLISEKWIDFVRTPAPATARTGRQYGGQWWLVPDDRQDVPRDA